MYRLAIAQMGAALSTPTESSESLSEAPVQFDEYRLPTQEALLEAAALEVIDEEGRGVNFGDLYPVEESQTSSSSSSSLGYMRENKTVVFFIRTFLCGQCQDYTKVSLASLDPEVIAAANIRVVIVTNGSWKAIKRYRQLFSCPYEMFVDPTLRLYKVLGMDYNMPTKEKLVSLVKAPKDVPSYHQSGIVSQTAKGLKNLLKMGSINTGSIFQLGGEFVILPGYRCEYAHRMPNKFAHELAPDVMRQAGIKFPERRLMRGPVSNRDEFTASQLGDLMEQEKEVQRWRQQ